MAILLRDAQRLQDTFRVVLASGSPRRRELLAILGLPFDVVTSGFPEDLDKSQFTPEEYVAANAQKKCAAVVASQQALASERPALVIGADTVVVGPDGRILEKPADAAAARQMLTSLAGCRHVVVTGLAVAVAGGCCRSAVERTEVEFTALSPEDIDAYVATGEPFDKAGGYGIQSKGALLVKGITGDYFNVVGLPLRRLAALLVDCLEDAAAPPPSKLPRTALAAAAPHAIDKLALVLVRDRKQLVARTRGKTAFFTPGGKREGAETDVEALTREVKEELNVELVQEGIKPYGVFEAQAFGKPRGTMVRMTCYTADFRGDLTPSNEIEELKWITSTEQGLSVTGVMILDDLKAKDLID